MITYADGSEPIGPREYVAVIAEKEDYFLEIKTEHGVCKIPLPVVMLKEIERILDENKAAACSDLRAGKDRRQRWEGPPDGIDQRTGQRRALLSAAEREALLS